MEDCPAPAGRTRFDIAEIVRLHRAALEAEIHLTPAQRRVLSAISVPARVFEAFVADTSAANSNPDVDVDAVFKRRGFELV